MSTAYYMKAAGLGLVAAWIAACTDINANTPRAQGPFDGRWEMNAQAAPPIGKDGEACTNGNGLLLISGNAVTGTATDTAGYTFDVNGTIDESGKMSGTLTFSGYDAASVEAEFDAVQGKGTWLDTYLYNCGGTWVASRK